jgi:hypothetical protein
MIDEVHGVNRLAHRANCIHTNCLALRGESYAVRANPILGGLHHEYFLAPACA